MQYKKLPHSDLKVSRLCLGTMTFGIQNTMQDAFDQLDYAFDRGINFIDTAELYPFPPEYKNFGKTEMMIGAWIKNNPAKKQKIVIATKICGPGRATQNLRNGARLDRANIIEAVDNSLQRLCVDAIDLYQIHWPERNANYFGKLGFDDSKTQDDSNLVKIDETLRGLEEVIKSGKVRYVGVSNETAWGLMKYIEFHKSLKLPKIITIQNPYNLLNRSFEVGLAEVCFQEEIALLPYSPLAFGVLTGKYLQNQFPENARLTLYPGYKRYRNSNGINATMKYQKIARQNGVSLTTLALAFINSRNIVGSNIIGATTLDQLKENIDSIDFSITSEILADIEKVHQVHSNPCP